MSCSAHGSFHLDVGIVSQDQARTGHVVCVGGGGNGEGAGTAAMKRQKYFAFTNPQ